jgi:hypothetical protein
MEHYGFREPLEKLVSECRDLLLANTVSPSQRIASTEVKHRP